MQEDDTQPLGHIEMKIEHADGRVENRRFKNAVLRRGREALAAALANSVGDDFNFYINRMVFGSGGSVEGTPKFVNTDRNALFGITRANKGVIATVDPNNAAQVIFTSVLGFDEANGYTLNEMGLKMANDDLYSMATFADLNKTGTMQITWNWRLSFV